MGFRIGMIGAMALACCIPSLAQAGAMEAAGSATLTLKVRGHISPRCEISMASTTTAIMHDGAGSESMPFKVDCNQPLNVRMTSANGGLAHSSHGKDGPFPGFASFVPYTATFAVGASDAHAVVATSEDMVKGAGGKIGVAPFAATGALALDWAPAGTLLGGSYSDVIEIRVSAAGEGGSPSP